MTISVTPCGRSSNHYPDLGECFADLRRGCGRIAERLDADELTRTTLVSCGQKGERFVHPYLLQKVGGKTAKMTVLKLRNGHTSVTGGLPSRLCIIC